MIRKTLSVFVTILSMAGRVMAADPASAIHLRVYDYAAVPPEMLAEAQQIVSKVYRDAGVATVWEPTLALTLDASIDPCTAPYVPVADVSIMLLNAEMSRRAEADLRVVARAAVDRQAPGRIAYVHVERMSGVTRDPAQSREVLGYVMAHEVGHLLLPPGSHTRSGLMRGDWTARELGEVSASDFELTVLQRHSLQQGALARRRAR